MRQIVAPSSSPPQSIFPSYPAWIWRLRPGGDWELTDQLHKQLLENAVDLEQDDLALIQEATCEHKITVVCGLHELDGSLSRSTLSSQLALSAIC